MRPLTNILFIAAFVFISLGGCKKEDNTTQADTKNPTTTNDTATNPATDTANPTDDSTSGLDTSAPSGEVPPSDPDALFAFLAAKHYAAWPSESGPHPSGGPHGSGGVRTWINPILAESLAADAEMHPQGAAAVKELYAANGALAGWAVSIKLAADSAGGDNWYWYEHFDTTSAANPPYAAQGLALCKNCHSGGQDLVLIPFPLQ